MVVRCWGLCDTCFGGLGGWNDMAWIWECVGGYHAGILLLGSLALLSVVLTLLNGLRSHFNREEVLCCLSL
jgi:hypothetical protein